MFSDKDKEHYHCLYENIVGMCYHFVITKINVALNSVQSIPMYRDSQFPILQFNVQDQNLILKKLLKP